MLAWLSGFTWIFWLIVGVVVVATLGTVAYIKLRIEPVTERWASFQETIRGYRTQAFAGAVGVLGLAEVIDPAAVIQILGPNSRGWVTIIVALCIYLLRRITNTPPGRFGSSNGGGRGPGRY